MQLAKLVAETELVLEDKRPELYELVRRFRLSLAAVRAAVRLFRLGVRAKRPLLANANG